MMSDVVTNLRILKPSRKKRKPGDLFVMEIPNTPYIYGRVISTTARWTTSQDWPLANLIYVYRVRSHTKTVPDRDLLTPDNLLLPPMFTNNLGWSRGYFETIASIPLGEEDLLPQHCFRRSTGQYFDDKGNELPGPIGPVGSYGLDSFRTIDDAVSEALGIPLAPEET